MTAGELGRLGERMAAEHLERAGLVVLDRNWRPPVAGRGGTRSAPRGELDLVARDGPDVAVVEVKTRRATGFGTPAEAVTVRKAARLRSLAGAWLAAHSDVRPRHVRFDVVAVVREGGAWRVDHLRGAF